MNNSFIPLADEDELSFDPDDIITNIQMVSWPASCKEYVLNAKKGALYHGPYKISTWTSGRRWKMD